MTTKFNIDYNEINGQPFLVFQQNTASTSLEDKLLREFVALSTDITKKITATKVDNIDGTSHITLTIANI